MLEIAYWITQALLAIGALCAVYRVFRGPSVLDRVISVDVILIIVGSVMLTDMAFRRHQDFILFVVITAMIGFLGAVAIARYVAAGPHQNAPEDATAPVPIVEPAAPGASAADESTSWFAALTKSGFVPKKEGKQ